MRSIENHKYSETLVFVVLSILLGVPPLFGTSGQDESKVARLARVDRAPLFEEFLSMDASSEAATHMTKIEGLVQRTPSDGAPVSERCLKAAPHEVQG
jgi:hypothetical protein